MRPRDRIREHLLALIEARAVGQAIPSERHLAEQLGTSRRTLRAVVSELMADGWLVREHGRGVFVGAPRTTQRIVAGTAGRTKVPPAPGHWTNRVLDHAVVPAGTAIGARLRIAPAVPVLRIARRRMVDGVPLALETIHVPHALVPGLDAADVEAGSFYALLRTRYGIVPTDADQEHEARSAGDREAAVLGIPVGAPILTLERLTRDQHGRPVEYTRAAYRGDRYRVVTRLALADQPSAEHF
jgi:GntR family transcriptional regulator